MNNQITKSAVKLLSFAGVAIVMTACSSEPSPWAKKDSPWDQRRGTEVEAPAAETYKADLEMPDNTGGNEVELSYQTNAVDSFAPVPAEAEPEPVEVSAMMAEESPEAESGSIMDQPATHYTIQLMASVDVDRVLRFADNHQISTQYIVATERDGVIWHVLLLDVYPDYSAAVVARDEIAPQLKTQPWIRSVGSVQKITR